MPASDDKSALAEPLAPATARAQAAVGLMHPGSVSGETGGPTGPEPTRYGDWEKRGIISDF